MNVAVLGDLHHPWPDWKLLEGFQRWCRKTGIEHIVQVGDLTDQKSWSKYDQETDSPNPDAEWEMCRRSLDRFADMFSHWSMDIIQGNHDIRIMMAAMRAKLPRQLVKTLNEVCGYKGWNWHFDKKKHLTHDGVSYIHGDEISGKPLTKALWVGRPTVHGHEHGYAQIEYGTTIDRGLWGMNVGCGINLDSVAVRYSKRAIRRPWLGWGQVRDGLPQLFPWNLMRK